ncbi:16S rRNA (adenine(1518)-N(6)/adenine(1519)-N(6))-dimethyltransferase RsmA [Halocola ammonii]
MSVKPKKHLGQHFLKDPEISKRIADSLTHHGNYDTVLEIGPGTGALTKFLLQREEFETVVIEVDLESIHYLNQHFAQLQDRIINEDFLTYDLEDSFDSPFAVTGNFPYNISSQILFRVYENKDMVPEVVGMFQKEVAERISVGPGTKAYGILSVLLQAFYEVEYLFTVDQESFDPPPKVKSGVVRLRRNEVKSLDCDEKKFKMVIKTAFGQRRKTIRNSLKSFWKSAGLETSDEIWNKRPEQLGVGDFVWLTNQFFS